MILVSRDQSPKVLQPTDRALDLPATAVATQRTAILRGGLDAVAAVWAHQFDTAPLEPDTQWVAIGSQIVNKTPRQTTQSTSLQQRFNQRHFMRAGTGDLNAQWQTGRVAVHHNLGAFATLGLAHAFTPFFAEENVPSANVSSVFTCPHASSRRNNRDHACSQIPASVQSRSRRQHVLGEGKCRGKSFQRAPLRRIQRMPSTQSRAAAGGRPPCGDGVGTGNRSLIKNHCSSVSSVSGSIVDPAGAEAPSSRDRNMSDLLRHSVLRRHSPKRLASKTKF